MLGKDIYWYGIIICAGFILAALYVNSRTKDFGITSDNLTDCLIICVPLGIICARIYYVVFEWGYYAQHPGEIIAIWTGGKALAREPVRSRGVRPAHRPVHRPLGQFRQRRGPRRPDNPPLGHDHRRPEHGPPDLPL